MTNITKLVLTSLMSTFFLTSLVCSIALLSMASTVHAEEGGTSEAIYANGGIGQEEADEMRAKAGSFNLRLYLSEGKPAHAITDAQITITDKKGNVKLDLASGGPMLFLDLANGSYKIIAKYNGVTIIRNVIITTRRGANIYLNWKSAGNDVDTDTEDTLSQSN
jgi:hypothetical protein